MKDVIVKDKIVIENLIYEVRGKQVMLDSDLARLYECANGTKTINLAVKRHINRFPERFMFQLSDEEYKNLRFQFETSSLENDYGGRRYNPYAFTEQGVGTRSCYACNCIKNRSSGGNKYQNNGCICNFETLY